MTELSEAQKEAVGETATSSAWIIAKCLSEGTGAESWIKVAEAFKDIRSELKGFDPAAPPNPFFLQNGHNQADSYFTGRYMRRNRNAAIASTALSFAGGFASGATMGVDTVSIAKHGHASASTLAHMKHLHQIASGYKQSETIQGWLEICLTAKKVKLAIRGGELAGSVIPLPGKGIGVALLAGAARAGVKLKYGTVISVAAMELHWRAHVEQKLSLIGLHGTKKTTKANGPASRVIFELFHRRGFYALGGQYNSALLINEPGGWYALRHRLLLM